MSDGERIPTNLRTLMILEILGRSDLPMTPTEINAQLGLPKQTVHRLCATLVETGFLAYSLDGKRLRPARRSRLIASGILFASRIHIARRQILEDVSRKVGETVNFVVPEQDGMSYLDRVETDWAFRVQLPIGTSVPFHCTASGKTFLAGLHRATRLRMVRSIELKRMTAKTLTDPDALLAELEQIARQGYAIDNEEFVDGMIAIAVPVLDRKKRFIAALATHGPTMRLNPKNLLERMPILLEAAERLTVALTDM
jgi:DNA-binding IclR family transcriptional regulator